MKPKNKYITRSHISEKKIRKLVLFFFSTKSFFEISKEILISPHTVQRYFIIFEKNISYYMKEFMMTREYLELKRKAHGAKSIPSNIYYEKYFSKRICENPFLVSFYFFFRGKSSYLKVLEILRKKQT